MKPEKFNITFTIPTHRYIFFVLTLRTYTWKKLPLNTSLFCLDALMTSTPTTESLFLTIPSRRISKFYSGKFKQRKKRTSLTSLSNRRVLGPIMT